MRAILKNIFYLATLLFLLLAQVGCSTAPKLDSAKIRPWSASLNLEYPQEKPVIAHYHKGDYDLYDLAANHTTIMGESTLNLVDVLFRRFQFKVLLVESIPYSSGESPRWFVEEARKGRTATFIPGGESALAVIYADEKKIPFFAGEPDHQDIYRALKSKGYTELDVIGFYVVRQVPQWIRERERRAGLFERKIPGFIKNYCQTFASLSCPNKADVLKWYKEKSGHELSLNISNEETAPYADGILFTQKISTEIGFIRDHFTSAVIENLLAQYKQVAVIYGAGHFVALRKSFDSAFGEPEFIEDVAAVKK